MYLFFEGYESGHLFKLCFQLNKRFLGFLFVLFLKQGHFLQNVLVAWGLIVGFGQCGCAGICASLEGLGANEHVQQM